MHAGSSYSTILRKWIHPSGYGAFFARLAFNWIVQWGRCVVAVLSCMWTAFVGVQAVHQNCFCSRASCTSSRPNQNRNLKICANLALQLGGGPAECFQQQHHTLVSAAHLLVRMHIGLQELQCCAHAANSCFLSASYSVCLPHRSAFACDELKFTRCRTSGSCTPADL